MEVTWKEQGAVEEQVKSKGLYKRGVEGHGRPLAFSVSEMQPF